MSSMRIFLLTLTVIGLMAQDRTSPAFNPSPGHPAPPTAKDLKDHHAVWTYLADKPMGNVIVIHKGEPLLEVKPTGELVVRKGLKPTKAAQKFAEEVKKALAITNCGGSQPASRTATNAGNAGNQ